MLDWCSIYTQTKSKSVVGNYFAWRDTLGFRFENRPTRYCRKLNENMRLLIKKIFWRAVKLMKLETDDETLIDDWPHLLEMTCWVRWGRGWQFAHLLSKCCCCQRVAAKVQGDLLHQHCKCTNTPGVWSYSTSHHALATLETDPLNHLSLKALPHTCKVNQSKHGWVNRSSFNDKKLKQPKQKQKKWRILMYLDEATPISTISEWKQINLASSDFITS